MTAPRKLGFDQIFRRAGVAAPDTLALCDPPNRMAVAGSAPRRLTFSETDRAISALAARFAAMQLPPGAVVAMRMPHCVESVISFLAALRAGLTVAPIPLLWRRAEIVHALGQAHASAFVTIAQSEGIDWTALACEAAAEVFSVRYVAAFGPVAADGVVALDDIFAAGESAPVAPAGEGRVLTWDVGTPGHPAFLRDPAAVLAAGLAVSLEAGLPSGTALLSTLPLTSLAGIAATLVPWLLATGTLFLHHPFDGAVLSDQIALIGEGAILAPAPIAGALATALAALDDGAPPAFQALLVHREPTVPADDALPAIDIHAFGEAGLVALARDADELPRPLPLGTIAAPSLTGAGTKVAETVIGETGTLWLRGAMTRLATEDSTAALDTGLPATAEDGHIVLAGPGETVRVGGYGFAEDVADVLRVRSGCDVSVTVSDDALLGRRIAVTAADSAAAAKELRAAGINALLAEPLSAA